VVHLYHEPREYRQQVEEGGEKEERQDDRADLEAAHVARHRDEPLGRDIEGEEVARQREPEPADARDGESRDQNEHRLQQVRAAHDAVERPQAGKRDGAFSFAFADILHLSFDTIVSSPWDNRPRRSQAVAPHRVGLPGPSTWILRPRQVTLRRTFTSHTDRTNTAWKNASGSGKSNAVSGPKLPTLRNIHHSCTAYNA
jgi:hypothetical protein